jgi:hypothetical protein
MPESNPGRRSAMKKFAVLTIVMFVAALVFAQTKVEPKYDKTAEMKLKGTVEEVKEVPGSCCTAKCIHLMLRTDKGLLEIQVAPEAFLKDIEVKFDKGDKIEVTAAKVMKDGAEIYLAREINQNGSIVLVRDGQGDPVWNWKKG